ncbi:hypothetical protein EV182_008021 [Spiromyces aspiralis]|uniref:Uncharacterized protein n=1 Tax=Spiromyces aspiralis TaxID=68401 RepID=A0ACC1H6T7_9FUNG|nr:hypothetical protein EV182_008021 [Spiromyces aspiralis]
MILLDTWPGNNDPLWAVKATNIGIGNSISQTPQFAPPLSSSLFAAATPANPQLPAVTNPATLTGAPGSPTPPSGGNAPVTQHNDATTKLPATSGNTLYHFVYVHDGTSEIFDVIDINSLRSSLDAREASEYEQNSRASSTLGDGRASPILLLFPIVTITAGHILTLLL